MRKNHTTANEFQEIETKRRCDTVVEEMGDVEVIQYFGITLKLNGGKGSGSSNPGLSSGIGTLYLDVLVQDLYN